MPFDVLTKGAVRKASRDLGAQGVMATRENIAEKAAVDGYNDAEDEPQGAASRDLGVGGPTSEIAKRKQAEADAKRNQGPPEELLRRLGRIK